MGDTLENIERNVRRTLQERNASSEDFAQLNQDVISKVIENPKVQEVWHTSRAFDASYNLVAKHAELNNGVRVPPSLILSEENIDATKINPEAKEALKRMAARQENEPALQPLAYHDAVREALKEQGITNPSGDFVDAIKNNIEHKLSEQVAPTLELPFSPPPATPNMPPRGANVAKS